MRCVDFLNKELRVVIIGLETFADSLKEQGVKTITVDWRPPVACADPQLLEALKKLQGTNDNI